MTAEQLLEIARREKPGVNYTRNRRGTAIAAWHQDHWTTVAMRVVGGGWVTVGDLFIDEQPVNKQGDWIVP